MKTLILLILLTAYNPGGFAQVQYPFQDYRLSIDERVDNIISLLTLEEKIDVITNFSVPRLNISSPGSAEGIHQAVIRTAPNATLPIATTSFSQVYGMGETWDPALIQQAGAVEAYEARYVSQSEKYKGSISRGALVLWGPTSDLARDPRWGRNDESFSEDAYLTGTMATAFAKGIQGDDPDFWMAASLLKHFMANSNETTRARSSSDFDERLMREYYSVPFRMAFLEGGVKSYMAAYNAWNGIPMHVNPVLKEVVAKEWGADWIVTSDAGAIGYAVTQHKYFDNTVDVFAAAVKAGMNNFLGGNTKDDILTAMSKKMLTEADINEVIRGKFKTMIKLGMLDPKERVPYSNIGAPGEPEPWNTEKHKAVALQVARESVVLLKNDNGILPLDAGNIKSVAVIGPLADKVLFDFYSGTAPYAISVLQGIQSMAGSRLAVNYVANNDYDAAVDAAKSSDFAIVVVGNDPMCGLDRSGGGFGGVFNPDGSTKECIECGDGREGRDRTSLDLPSEDLIKDVFAVNPNTIVVLISSFPYAINWSQANVPAILHITHAAQEQGTAVAEVLFGDYNPAGRLVQTWPTGLHQLPRMLDYNIRNGRTYMYFKDKPLYPFGYGLSYTSFEYSALQVSSETMQKNGSITVSVNIRNTGQLQGDEVVQLYVQHPQSKVVRPVKELKGFSRTGIKPGETRTVTFELKAESLSWWNENTGKWEVESGPVNIMIGSSSADIRLQKTVNVN